MFMQKCMHFDLIQYKTAFGYPLLWLHIFCLWYGKFSEQIEEKLSNKKYRTEERVCTARHGLANGTLVLFSTFQTVLYAYNKGHTCATNNDTHYYPSIHRARHTVGTSHPASQPNILNHSKATCVRCALLTPQNFC